MRTERLPEYRVEEALRARLDEALELRRVVEQRLLRRPEIVDRLLGQTGGADEEARRHLVNRRHRDAAIVIADIEKTLAQVRDLGRVLDAITALRHDIASWRNEVDTHGVLHAAATLRIPSRLIAVAERFAAAGRPRAARLLVDMAHAEQRRWSREAPRENAPVPAAPAPPSLDGEPTSSLEALAVAGRPALAARLAEDLVTQRVDDAEKRARRARLLTALDTTRRRAEGALRASAHEDPSTATGELEKGAQ